MERADQGLAFMLQYENVAWYDSGEVRILDRRVYPRKVEFVTCRTYEEVVQALRDMVTQSTGPFTAAAMAMALAAYQCREMPARQQLAYLEKAADVIAHARPTTVGRMARITGGCMEAARAAIAQGVSDVAAYIRGVGPEHTVMTTDLGQKARMSSGEGMALFASLMEAEGITQDDLRTMMVDNPRKLLDL